MHLDVVRHVERGEGLKQLAFVNKHETEVISGRVLLVDFPECGGKIKPPKEESDGNSFSS